MRHSKQRQLILDLVKGTTSHPTAEAVWAEARRSLPRLSLGTVYRNLRLLAESGQIQELDLPTAFSRFDGNAAGHPHFLCTECGRVYDLDYPLDPELDRRLSEASGYAVERHTLNFYGRCGECKNKGG